MIVAGIGCRRGCPGDEIATLVREAERRAGHPISRLAAPDFKGDEPGLHDAAAMLALPLVFVPADALALIQPRCHTRSAIAEAATGFASVAEASALAVSGGRLLLPRIAGGRATCAVAGP